LEAASKELNFPEYVQYQPHVNDLFFVLSALIISLLAIYQYLFGFQYILKYLAKENITNPLGSLSLKDK